MIQVAKLETKIGKNFQWTLAETPRNEMRTQSSLDIEDGFFADHLAENCRIRNVSLQDYPFGWTDFERIKLEACAVCVVTQKIYACTKWGAVWPPVGERKISPITATDKPSLTFLEALTNFHKYYQ